MIPNKVARFFWPTVYVAVEWLSYVKQESRAVSRKLLHVACYLPTHNPLFQLEFPDDPLGVDRCFVATR